MNSIDLKRKFLKKDNLLILHLTDRCNNRCNFCMVKGGHGSFSFPYNEALKLIDTLPAHSKVDLFGGEPTLYPCFFDLLKYIKSQDMKCSIATNGRLFSKKEFIESVAQITGNDLYVRTSLYGLAALSHDRITGARNSFSELMLGIKNIVSLQMPCQVNIVLTKLNLPDLVGMTQLVIDKGVKRIKFGLIVNSRSCINLVPSLSEISPQLLKSIELAKKNNLKVTIEKAPLCLMPDYIHEFSSERELGEWPRYFDDQGECSSCIVHRWCDGLDPEYAEAFGPGGIKRIDMIPSSVLVTLPDKVESVNIRFLKTNLFILPEDLVLENSYTEIMTQLIDLAKEKFARIAFVPSRLIQTRYTQGG